MLPPSHLQIPVIPFHLGYLILTFKFLSLHFWLLPSSHLQIPVFPSWMLPPSHLQFPVFPSLICYLLHVTSLTLPSFPGYLYFSRQNPGLHSLLHISLSLKLLSLFSGCLLTSQLSFYVPWLPTSLKSKCVGHSFAYVAYFILLRYVWIRTQRAAVASRCVTHLPNL
jgi:hypothetical protein